MKSILSLITAGLFLHLPLSAAERLSAGEVYRTLWTATGKSDKVYLSFDARIDAGKFSSGAAEALQVKVNGAPVTVDRLSNKQLEWIHGQRSFASWRGANDSLKVLYHRWDDEAPNKGRLHRYVFEISSLLHEGQADVEFRSIFAGIEGAKVELRNVEIREGGEVERHPVPIVEQPLYLSQPLRRFRDKAIAYHKGLRLNLNTAAEEMTEPVRVERSAIAPAGSVRATGQEDGSLKVETAALPLEVTLQVGTTATGWRRVGEGWTVEQKGDGAWVFASEEVRIERRVISSEFGLDVVDRVMNLTDRDLPVGLLYEFALGDSSKLTEFRLFGRKRPIFYANTTPDRESATVPTAWLSTAQGGFGLLVDRDVLRNQASYLAWDDTLGVGTDMLYLPPGGSQEVGWALSPDNGQGYFGFVNRVRHRWQAYQEIGGLFGFVYPGGIDDAIDTPEKIAAFLQDTGITHPCLPLHLHAESGSNKKRGRGIYGNEPAAEVSEALGRAADFIALARKGGVSLPFLVYTDPHLIGVGKDRSGLEALKASQVTDYRGGFVEYREGWLYNLFPGVNTSAGAQFIENLKRYLDTPGISGIFLDEWDHSRARIAYNFEDGVTALLNDDFRLQRKVGIVPLMMRSYQTKVADLLQSRKAIIYANQFDSTQEALKLPIVHFAEPTQYDSYLLHGAQLGRTPLSLTVKRSSDPWLDVQEFLKHGVLTCFYAKRLTGDHLLKEVYPITVRQQGPGYVVGDDRIVTLRSGSYALGEGIPLEAHVFGGENGQRLRTVRAEAAPGERTVLELTLNRDNQEVAIIKAAAPVAQP